MRRFSCLLELSSSRQSDLVSVYHSYLESVGGIAHIANAGAADMANTGCDYGCAYGCECEYAVGVN